MARLLVSGDLDSLFRRLTVIAYEDIGLANPSMGPKVDACIRACERLGIDEGRIGLANVLIELALSPKSNSAYLAIDKALNEINSMDVGRVPKHIKTNSKDYKYPHNFPNAFVKQQYLPDKIKDHIYYIPKTTSKYEVSLKKINDKIKNID